MSIYNRTAGTVVDTEKSNVVFEMHFISLQFNSSIASPHHIIYRIPSSFYHIIPSSIYLFTLSISSLEFIYLITSHLFINRITSHPFIYLTSAGANINAVDKLGIDWCSPHCSVACSDRMHPTGEEKCECFDQQRGT